MITLQPIPASAQPACATAAAAVPAPMDPAQGGEAHPFAALLAARLALPGTACALAGEAAHGALGAAGAAGAAAHEDADEDPATTATGEDPAALLFAWACCDAPRAGEAAAEEQPASTAATDAPARASRARRQTPQGEQSASATLLGASATLAGASATLLDPDNPSAQPDADPLSPALLWGGPGERQESALASPGAPARPSEPSAATAPVPPPAAPDATAQALARQQPPSLALASPLGSNAWTAELHQGLSLLVQERTSIAELRVNPAELGPLHIRIDYSDAQPSIVVSAQHAETRDALDAALPRLRELLAHAGVHLGQASVEHGGGGSAQAREDAPRHGAAREQSSVQVMPAGAARAWRGVQRLIDTYA